MKPRAKRAVNQIDPITNEVLATYESLTDAAVAVHGCVTNIWRACNHGQRHRGFYWQYA